MLNDIKRLKILLLERDILYILGGVSRRWKPGKDVIYILQMHLEKRCIDPGVSVFKITDTGKILQFAHDRELEDSNWEQGKYVQDVIQRINRGDVCFGAQRDGKIVSVIFASRGPCHLGPVGYYLKIPSGTMGYYDAYTLASYRRQGLYSNVFSKCVNTSLDEGYHTAWMWIMRHNIISLKTHDSLDMNHVFMEIALHQRWGFRWHKVRAVDLSIQDLLNDNSA